MRLIQLRSQRKDDKHLVFDGSDTVAKGGRTAQGGPFNQHDRTARVKFPSALMPVVWFFLTAHLNSNLKNRTSAESRLPTLLLSLWLHTDSEPQDPLKRFTSVCYLTPLYPEKFREKL